MDILDEHATDPGFSQRWRKFERACALALLPTLSDELRERAAAWIGAADAYESGALNLGGLTAARVEAWEFHDARRDVVPQVELSAVRAVMSRLWPDDENPDWHLAAANFLEFCSDAGLSEPQWYAVMQAHFADLLAGSNLPKTSSPPRVV